MDSVKSFFAGSNKANDLGNHQQQNGPTNGSDIPNRWGRNSGTQHTESSSSNSASTQNAKRKDSDNYFYIMWRA
ncbi:uncharacterized protein LOC117890804 [Drosophila subobscura]|uniref:uncharacterized protein LOC117890804 n=1 Tax=Drosophila subobscura TaxID=7241 RepID=UPI00155A9C37|nr:uncharacterized protein LOC117890804 [Drosophila subobscura]